MSSKTFQIFCKIYKISFVRKEWFLTCITFNGPCCSVWTIMSGKTSEIFWCWYVCGMTTRTIPSFRTFSSWFNNARCFAIMSGCTFKAITTLFCTCRITETASRTFNRYRCSFRTISTCWTRTVLWILRVSRVGNFGWGATLTEITFLAESFRFFVTKAWTVHARCTISTSCFFTETGPVIESTGWTGFGHTSRTVVTLLTVRWWGHIVLRTHFTSIALRTFSLSFVGLVWSRYTT